MNKTLLQSGHQILNLLWLRFKLELLQAKDEQELLQSKVKLDFLQAKDVAGEDVEGLDLNIYNTSTYIFIGISAIVVIISFFGCCGAWKVKKFVFCNFQMRQHLYSISNFQITVRNCGITVRNQDMTVRKKDLKFRILDKIAKNCDTIATHCSPEMEKA